METNLLDSIESIHVNFSRVSKGADFLMLDVCLVFEFHKKKVHPLISTKSIITFSYVSSFVISPGIFCSSFWPHRIRVFHSILEFLPLFVKLPSFREPKLNTHATTL